MWIYGALIGFITVLIRFKGGLPEGVMYAILLGNALSPLIDNLTQPRTLRRAQKSKGGGCMSAPTNTAHTSAAIPMIKVLGIVSLLCGVLIVVTQITTLGRIRQNQELLMRESVAQLLPGIQKQIMYGVEPSGDLRILPGLEGEGHRFFAGYDASGNFLGVVIEASDRGYADVIQPCTPTLPDSQIITGFQVVDMRETPGLGNRIGSDKDFLDNFKSLDATHPIQR